MAGYKNIIFLSLAINFPLTNSVDPDEMSHNAAFHLGLQLFAKVPVKGFLVHEGLNYIHQWSR